MAFVAKPEGEFSAPFSSLSRESAPPKIWTADNGYAAAADEVETVGVVSIG